MLCVNVEVKFCSMQYIHTYTNTRNTQETASSCYREWVKDMKLSVGIHKKNEGQKAVHF